MYVCMTSCMCMCMYVCPGSQHITIDHWSCCVLEAAMDTTVPRQLSINRHTPHDRGVRKSPLPKNRAAMYTYYVGLQNGASPTLAQSEAIVPYCIRPPKSRWYREKSLLRNPQTSCSPYMIPIKKNVHCEWCWIAGPQTSRRSVHVCYSRTHVCRECMLSAC